MVPQPPQHEREGRKAEIRFRLTAAGRKKEQVHDLALGVRRVGESREIHQHEGELESAPLRRIIRAPPTCGASHRAIGDLESIQRLRPVQSRETIRDPIRRDLRSADQILRRHSLGCGQVQAVEAGFLRSDPVAIC